MSEVKINATDWLILIDPTGAGTFKPVACLTSNKLTSSHTDIDVSSKCGNEWINGSKFEDTIEGEGFAIDESGTPSKESYSQLHTLYASKAVFAARFGKANPATGDIYYQGNVFITKFDIDAPWNAALKFNVTFRVALPPLSQYAAY